MWNADPGDADHDGVGDLCDACPEDPDDDADVDGLCADPFGLCPFKYEVWDTLFDWGVRDGCGETDACPSQPDPLNVDTDGDGVGDVCDNCPFVKNADQADNDRDGVGDACECFRC